MRKASPTPLLTHILSPLVSALSDVAEQTGRYAYLPAGRRCHNQSAETRQGPQLLDLLHRAYQAQPSAVSCGFFARFFFFYASSILCSRSRLRFWLRDKRSALLRCVSSLSSHTPERGLVLTHGCLFFPPLLVTVLQQFAT